jgi:glycosyltransferase involved in cell wall biosynthesis
MKKKILILAGFYTPSIKGGGPIQSIKNLVDQLGDFFDFYILAADRDLNDESPFINIKIDKWIKVGKAKVYYTNINKMGFRKYLLILKSLKPDILYLNSFFSVKDSIMPIILKKFNFYETKIILAPRGQFSEGALGFRNIKKSLYFRIAKIFRLYKDILWHTTNVYEKKEVERKFGFKSNVFVVNNLTQDYSNKTYRKLIDKSPGSLTMVYIARIHPMKNLYQVLDILSKINNKVIFNIYGPIEDNNYWEKCLILIKKLSKNISVNYHGKIRNELIHDVYLSNHVSILLTHGENFGHSIIEALIGGCPVIISDKTPWKNLASQNVGYDICLEDENKIIAAVNQFVKMNNFEYKKMSVNAFNYAKIQSDNKNTLTKYVKMFNLDKS